MSRLLWLFTGLMLGAGLGAFSKQYPVLGAASCLVAVVLVAIAFWYAGQRDRKSAVATAVAKAKAEATAQANAAVNLAFIQAAGREREADAAAAALAAPAPGVTFRTVEEHHERAHLDAGAPVSPAALALEQFALQQLQREHAHQT